MKNTDPRLEHDLCYVVVVIPHKKSVPQAGCAFICEGELHFPEVKIKGLGPEDSWPENWYWTELPQ
jgi:hypothetical protein